MTHVALLRAINLAGRNRVAMADLRELAEALGCRNARTLLQSGNLLFQPDRRSAAAFERAFEAAAARTFGFAIDFFVRSASEWEAIVAKNPFPSQAANDPGRLVVLFLKDAPTSAAVKALEAAVPGREIVRANGRHAYIYFPEGQGRSKLTTAVIEKHLGTRGTARNWNTILKIAASSRATQS